MWKYAKMTTLIAVMSLGACATAPTPAEICSAEWIAPRAERAMKDFKRDTTKTIRTFRKSADKLKDGGTLGPLQMFSMMNALSKLANKMENGRAMRDMRTLSETCNDPDLLKNAMNDFMREQGISEKFISFINDIDEYTKLITPPVQSEIKT
ncbi:MAG: hypothetical protein L3J65_03360 [Robiginitomaculum sp.]|nr:hypothetical protein [Robiginitomaculum sp.]